MKFPSTSGGAAGSLVRGNEFYRDAPAPYSYTRRGQDTIHVVPGHIRVERKSAEQPNVLRPELILTLRLTAEQVAISNAFPGVGAQYGTAPHIRRLHPLVLSEGDGTEQRLDWPQDELWQFPGTFQAKGHIVPVGDGYFVHVAAGTSSSKVPTPGELQLLDYAGSRVALVHKENLDGPYLNTVTRRRTESGHSLVFHRVSKLQDRGFADRPGDLLKDQWGANYFLEEARQLLSREWLIDEAMDVEGHTISAAPLGWMDKEHRYAFAVFGHTAAGIASGQVECLVYCTGTRALVHRTLIAPPPATNDNEQRWAGGLFSGYASARMAALGAGKMATVLMPRARYVPPGTGGLGRTSVNARARGVPPMLVWSEDFGRTFQKRYLHELEDVIARPFPANDYFPAGGLYYPELKFHIEPINAAGDFLLAIAAMNERPSGDIPSAAYDDLYAQRLDAGAEGPDYRRWWSFGEADRQSYMTLFKGSIHGGALRHLSGLDDLQLRFGHYLYKYSTGRNEDAVPPGTYRYNVLCNGLLGACTPMVKAYASGSAAVIGKTIEVTVPPGWDFTKNDHDIYRVVETFVLTSEDGGTTWIKSVLPSEQVSYSNVAEFGRLSNPQAPNGAASDPALLHASWTVIKPKQEATPERAAVPARIALLVRQHDSCALYVTDSPKNTLRTWTLRKLRDLPVEPVLQAAQMATAWDKGECTTPSALAYLGDVDSEEYPEYLSPALPQLFEREV